MVAGLPWTTWLLLFASFGIGVAIVLAFYFSKKRVTHTDSESSGT